MSNDIILKRFDHSDNIKLNSRPYIVLRINGPSYINKKAASLLNLKNGDSLTLFHTDDLKNWYVGSDEIGATVLKSGGLFRFCDTKAVKSVFESYQVQGKKAFFVIADQLQTIGDKKVLFIIPKPLNVS